MAIEDLSAFLRSQDSNHAEAIQRVMKLKEALIAALNPGELEPDQETWRAADKKANRLLGAYETESKLVRDDEGYGFIEHRVILREDCGYEYFEADGVERVIYLANQGVLHQLISCGNCERLFLPQRSGQKNCSAACSKKAYESGLGFRAKRNKWARENYRNLKTRDELNLRAAGHVTKKNIQHKGSLRRPIKSPTAPVYRHS